VRVLACALTESNRVHNFNAILIFTLKKMKTRAFEKRWPPPRRVCSDPETVCRVRIRILTPDPDDFQNLISSFWATFVVKFWRRSVQYFYVKLLTDRQTYKRRTIISTSVEHSAIQTTVVRLLDPLIFVRLSAVTSNLMTLVQLFTLVWSLLCLHQVSRACI